MAKNCISMAKAFDENCQASLFSMIKDLKTFQTKFEVDQVNWEQLGEVFQRIKHLISCCQ